MKNDRLLTTALILLALAYPALVYFGLKAGSPKPVAWALMLLFLLRLATMRNAEGRKRLAMILLPPLLLCALSAVVNRSEFMLFLPVFTSLVFLVSFGVTLFGPVSAVETFARMVANDLSPAEIVYCRHVTQIWVCFFIVNGTIAFWTAMWGSLSVWALYNGLISYVAMGILFACELTYRYWRFRRYAGLPTDRFFRKLFQPKA